MKSVIVGTAGHIDHGKTALVKALTGIDADRLDEEKRRGITIDIGFAHLELPGPGGEILRLGFVDVPGHERFVRNMLAGVGGIDLVVLVIAADESIKPQTREHFDICRLLAVKRGIVALTKSDLVDRETLDVVKMEVEEFLRGTSVERAPSPAWSGSGLPSNLPPALAGEGARPTLASAPAESFPVIPVSSLTGAGLEDLKMALAALASDAPSRDAAALARLPIDRVFSMKGFGTVVTGTLISGTIRKEEELEVFPGGGRVRVRGVQVHGEAASRAEAGQRTALNIVGMQKEDLVRGMVAAAPGAFQSTSRIDVSLSLLPSAKPLKNRARVHLHAYTWETIAEVVLLEGAALKSGASAFAQLRLADPTLLLPGDRFIIRQFSPVVTIGGGVVLDAPPARKKQSASKVTEFLRTLESGPPLEILDARIARAGKRGLAIAAAVAETGWRGERIVSLAAELVAQKRIARVAEIMISATPWSAIAVEIPAAVAAFQQQNPLVPGIGREELRERLGLEAGIFAAAVEHLVRAKKLESAGELLHLPGRGVALKDEEAESKEVIEKAFAAAGLKVPAMHEVLAGLKVDRVRAQKIVTLLLRDKVLVKISDELVFHRDALGNLRALLAVEKAKSPRLDVARFKDLTGVSRKYAIPLLEWLDREHVTRRVGDARVIV